MSCFVNDALAQSARIVTSARIENNVDAAWLRAIDVRDDSTILDRSRGPRLPGTAELPRFVQLGRRSRSFIACLTS
jgi:hypothetical protein